MKTIILLLIICSSVFSQKHFESKTVMAGDSVATVTLNGTYKYIYVDVTDTGATYTDSVKFYNVTPNGDVIQLGIRRVLDYSDITVTNTPGAVRSYLMLDAYINVLRIVLSNAEYIAGRRTLVNIRAK